MSTHLITGAGSGIGAAVARRLLERGDELVLLARDAGRAKELAALHPGARTLVGDLGNPDRLSWAFGHQPMPEHLDSLLHIAGVVELGTVGDLTPKAWHHQLNANLVSPAELTRLMLPQLRVALRHEEHGNGVRVTSVYPGRTASPMQAKVHQQEGKEYDASRWIDPESVATTILLALDLPRDAEINDLTVRPGR